ncbi:MAG: Ribonuclease [Candidatus Parcubacteria bacterium]|jgi:ribonuclease P protein component
MLKKVERLTVSDIEALSQGKSVFGTLFSMRYTPASKSKFAVAVSKKVVPLAVDRNRIRRRAYSALERVKGNLSFPVYAMLMPKKEFIKAPFTDISKEVEIVFKKAGLLS